MGSGDREWLERVLEAVESTLADAPGDGDPLHQQLIVDLEALRARLLMLLCAPCP